MIEVDLLVEIFGMLVWVDYVALHFRLYNLFRLCFTMGGEVQESGDLPFLYISFCPQPTSLWEEVFFSTRTLVVVIHVSSLVDWLCKSVVVFPPGLLHLYSPASSHGFLGEIWILPPPWVLAPSWVSTPRALSLLSKGRSVYTCSFLDH